MTRGLSKQQRHILEMLRTKKLVNSDRGHFSTQEVVCAVHWEYLMWLHAVEENPFVSNRKQHIDFKKYERLRVSVYRALKSLERRGLIVNFLTREPDQFSQRYTSHQKRFWAVSERLNKREKELVEFDTDEREDRRIKWKWAAFHRDMLYDKETISKWNEFVETLPQYNVDTERFTLETEEDIEEIRQLWDAYLSKKKQPNKDASDA